MLERLGVFQTEESLLSDCMSDPVRSVQSLHTLNDGNVGHCQFPVTRCRVIFSTDEAINPFSIAARIPNVGRRLVKPDME